MKPDAIVCFFWTKYYSAMPEFLKTQKDFILTYNFQHSNTSALGLPGGRVIPIESFISDKELETLLKEVQGKLSNVAEVLDSKGWAAPLNVDEEYEVRLGSALKGTTRQSTMKAAGVIRMLELAATKYRIRLLVVNEDFTAEPRAMVLWARHHGIPTLHVSHSLSVFKPYTVHSSITADYLTVYGRAALAPLIECGIAEERIFLTGNPAWDNLLHLRSEKDAARNRLRGFLQLVAEAKVVSFGTTFNARLSAGEDQSQVERSLHAIFAAQRLHRERGRFWYLVIKTRVANDATFNKMILDIAAMEKADPATFTVRREDLDLLMLGSDVVVSVDSNLSIDALMADTHAINLATEFCWRLGPSYDADSGIVDISMEELDEELERVLYDKQYGDMLARNRRQSQPRYQHGTGEATKTLAAVMSQLSLPAQKQEPGVEVNGPDLSYYSVWNQKLFNLIPKKPMRVLELGCGAGILGKTFKEQFPGSCYTGIELSTEAAEMASRYLDEVHVGNLDSFDWKALGGKKFECLVMGDVLEHLRDPKATLCRAAEFLEDGGYMVCSIPNISHWTILLGLLHGHWEYDTSGILDATHVRFFTPATFERMLNECGFEVVRSDRNILNTRYPESFMTFLSEIGIDHDEFIHTAQTFQTICLGRYGEKPSRALTGGVTVIIPVLNKVELTRGCLESIAANLPVVPFEVVVVDNGSSDGTYEWMTQAVKSWPWLRYHRLSSNTGFASACNTGVMLSNRQFIHFLNNDTILTPGWLDSLVRVLDDHTVGIVGNKLLYQNGLVQHAGIGFRNDRVVVHPERGMTADSPQVIQTKELAAVTGASLLIRREIFDEIGGFDDRYYKLYHEDIDLCLKAFQLGWKIVYTPESCFIHLEQQSSPVENAQREALESRIVFEKRWGSYVADRLVSGDNRLTTGKAYQAPESGRAVSKRPRKLKVLFQTRENYLLQPGGDTVVLSNLQTELAGLGVDIEITSNPMWHLGKHDLVHLYNLCWPALVEPFSRNAQAQGKNIFVHAFQEDFPRYQLRARLVFEIFKKYLSMGQKPNLLQQMLDLAKNEGSWPSASARFTLEHASAIFTCGKSESDVVTGLYAKARCVETPYGASVKDLAVGPELFRKQFGIDDDFVLCVGRLEIRKNQLMLLAALENDDIPLVFADGGFTYQPPYTELCAQYKRKGRTIFTGRLTDEMLVSAYRAAKVHALPSWYELPGLVSLEAAQYGCNIVASSWGALPDYLGDASYYCEPDNVQSVRESVLQALASPRDEKAKTVAAQFSWQRCAQAVLDSYRKVLDGNG